MDKEILITDTSDEKKEENTRSCSCRSSNAMDDVDEEERRRLHLLLTHLLSQLDTPRTQAAERPEQLQTSSGDDAQEALADERLEQPQTWSGDDAQEAKTNKGVGACKCGLDGEEIARELNKLKRQNLITHCLLSAGILITVGWQLSIATLLFKVRHGVSHPFKLLGGVLTGVLKPPRNNTNTKPKDGESNSSSLSFNSIQPSSLPGLKIPHMDSPAEILAEIKSYSISHTRKPNFVIYRQ